MNLHSVLRVSPKCFDCHASCLNALGKSSEAMEKLCWAALHSVWGEDGNEINPSQMVLATFRATYELCSKYAEIHPEVREIFDEHKGLHELAQFHGIV